MEENGFLIIQNGALLAPRPAGVQSMLIYDSKILKIGAVDAAAVQALGLPVEVVDASGCWVAPGLIDPHAHIIGAGGEQGFTSRMPEIQLRELICAGVTTVVGLLGTDTTTRFLSSLYSKAAQLGVEGMNAYIYTGGFQIPVQTIVGSIMDDLVMVDRVIGTGEIAVSDPRWVDPPLGELAKVVTETWVGGKMAGKAGVTHFHVGPGKNRLKLLNSLLDTYELPPEVVYATHITRSPELMEEAVGLARRGAYVDIDTVEGELGEHICAYLDQGGDPTKLTVSSDAHTPGSSPSKYFEQFRRAVLEHNLPLERILPFFTSNVADVLKLEPKGRLEEGKLADIIVLKKESLEIEHLIMLGRTFIKDGALVDTSEEEEQVEESQG